ncbi:uncharacterized protein DS421_15g520380 [Arachis hypogaea]|nr:uncharacterized protein DS421_15g520380 [Arachis hypogaea]
MDISMRLFLAKEEIRVTDSLSTAKVLIGLSSFSCSQTIDVVRNNVSVLRLNDTSTCSSSSPLVAYWLPYSIQVCYRSIMYIFLLSQFKIKFLPTIIF